MIEAVCPGCQGEGSCGGVFVGIPVGDSSAGAPPSSTLYVLVCSIFESHRVVWMK